MNRDDVKLACKELGFNYSQLSLKIGRSQYYIANTLKHRNSLPEHAAMPVRLLLSALVADEMIVRERADREAEAEAEEEEALGLAPHQDPVQDQSHADAARLFYDMLTSSPDAIPDTFLHLHATSRHQARLVQSQRPANRLPRNQRSQRDQDLLNIANGDEAVLGRLPDQRELYARILELTDAVADLEERKQDHPPTTITRS